MPNAESVSTAQSPRIIVFVDYWNFQLSINEIEARANGSRSPRHSFSNRLAQTGTLSSGTRLRTSHPATGKFHVRWNEYLRVVQSSNARESQIQELGNGLARSSAGHPSRLPRAQAKGLAALSCLSQGYYSLPA